MSTQPLPIGIRNNNPGNLRSVYGLNYKTELVGGFAKFKSLSDGVESLCRLTSDYYTEHGLHTLPSFIARYAPASENDVNSYRQNMLSAMGLPFIGSDTRDLHLTESYSALRFMRAIIICENGHPPTGWLPPSEWIDLTTWTACMHRSTKWRVV